MAITNYDRVGKTLELLRDGLKPFVARELENKYGKYWITTATQSWPNDLSWKDGDDAPQLDAAVLLRMMWDQWNDVFKTTLGHSERSLVSELREVRNKWAHQNAFTGDDAYRALDSSVRLLTAISAPQADEIEKMKLELLRVRFDEQVRSEKRRNTGTAIESQATGTLKPWREGVTPHKDVASGRYQQAEFAADLWQVHLGEGSDEYRNPAEFFRRTYLTESLKRLLSSAVQRLNGAGGDPVVQLQTNFGGGKTHSMLALYHLVSGVRLADLLGVDEVLAEAGIQTLPPKIKRVVLVGNKLSPGRPVQKADGTVVHTLWGELAYQLGGRAAYERIRADDEKATNPGDILRELFNDYGPCLILIDEWVAYARQLHDQGDLPGGSFETHFTFAQALTESAKLAKQCLLVISLPSSDTTGSSESPHARVENVEVGGERGREALERLRNAVGRVEASWRPASAEEGFEIVRRRLFEPLLGQAQFVSRDTVAKAFADLYRLHKQEFPPECSDADYEKRLKAAYPIHPEVFDRLYTDWSTLVKFQRTRGVLRLMAAVIHSLWEKGDRNPMIMPANIPIDDPRVQFELTRYLSDNWVPVIEKDVDGPSALPLRLDGEISSLGKFAASRRVARTVYLGSAPTTGAANLGIEDRRIKLGCVMPGESPSVFGDALRRLAKAATYLYEDGTRYWYSTQPTVTKLAEDRAEQLKRDPDKVEQELTKRLRDNLRTKGEFNRVHPLPQSSADVPDDMDARLVVLSGAQLYSNSKDPANTAEREAKAIFESRGNTPRLYRNTLVFLAADAARMTALDEGIRTFLAWDSILDEKEILNLSPHQVKQAEKQLKDSDSVAASRIPEAYQWLLVPTQDTPQSAITWQAIRLSGADALAVRASKKLRNDESLVTSLAGSRLRMDLDRVPLWRGDSVAVKQLAEDFARYLYLPRLQTSAVLTDAIRDGLGLLMWANDAFAYADSFDEPAGRYRGLRGGQRVDVSAESANGLLVKSAVAIQQLTVEAEAVSGLPTTATPANGAEPFKVSGPSSPGYAAPHQPAPKKVLKRFHGTVTLDPTRVGRDAGRIADEVIAHLAGQVGATVTITLEIEADLPSGATDSTVRTVSENARTLKFTSQGFEAE